jgi:hypothetical protein
VVIPIYDKEVQKKYETVKQEFMRNPDVLAVTACLKPPIGSNYIKTGAYPLDKGREARVNVDLNIIDFDFIDYFGLEIIAGRKFSKKISSDKKNAFIINETTVKRLGLASPDEAIGKKLRVGLNNREGTVIGVTRDFHISSLYKNIESLVMLYCPNNIYTMAVKIKSANIQRTISKLKETRLKFSKKYPFKFSFLDEDINRLYAVVWHGILYSGTKKKRDWRAQSIRGFGSQHCYLVVQRVLPLGAFSKYHCLADCLLCYEPLAAEFCLPGGYRIMDIPVSRCYRFSYCPDNRKLTGNKSSLIQPGRSFKE